MNAPLWLGGEVTSRGFFQRVDNVFGTAIRGDVHAYRYRISTLTSAGWKN
jgi:hypothetical protein